VQVRGWWLDKKIGFRGGVYEGTRAINVAGADVKSLPQLAGFVNVDILGTEEGGWLYGAYKWAKDPVLSIGLSGLYQSLAVRNALLPAAASNFTDQKMASADLFLDWPMTEQAEVVFEATGYLSGNGTASANTGRGFFADLGYRWGAFAPYVSYEYFQSDDCDSALTAAQCLSGRSGQPDAADSRNFKVGVNFFFNKNQNHLNVEFGANHGQSAYGAQSISSTNAGYAPAGSGNSLRLAATKSLLVHWNVLF